jgi:serine/threonine protein phosphatase PrpC
MDSKKELQMEDQDLAAYPFEDDSSLGVFAVFDGHVNKECAVVAKSLLTQVRKRSRRKERKERDRSTTI